MRQLSRKELMAILLVAGLSLVLYWQFGRGSGKPTGAEAARAAVKEVQASKLPPIVEVVLDQKPTVKIRSHSRNLFNYAKSPDEIAAEKKAAEDARRRAAEEEERRRIQAEADARAAAERARLEILNPTPPPAPPINLRLIGKMGTRKSPIAILEEMSPAGEKYAVREGEIILDKYKVIKIDFDSVTIGYVNPQWAQDTKVLRMGS